MLSDTSPEAHRVQIELLHGATIAERIARVRSLTAMTVRLSRRAIAEAEPHLTDQEVGLRFVELHYGKHLAAELREFLKTRRRWNPSTHRRPGCS